MRVDEIEKPDGLVLKVVPKAYQGETQGKEMTGVVVNNDFVMLDDTGVTGQKLPVNSVKIGSAEVTGVWSSLKTFYT